MSIVSYDGKRLIPAPQLSITKSYTTTPDGKKIGSVWNISVKGDMLTYKGSPDENNAFYTGSLYPPSNNPSPDYSVTFAENEHLEHVIRKQEAIRRLFAIEGKSFEVQSFNGSAPMKCNPKIKSVTFPEGEWFNRFNYQIDMEADIITINGVPLGEDSNPDGSNIFDQYISSLEDNWQIETVEEPESLTIPRTYRVNHSVNAVGKRFYDENGVLEMEAWQQAKRAVLPRLGLDLNFLTLSGLRDIPAYFSGYNYVRSESINETNGSYGINETWLMASGYALENFTIDSRKGIDSAFTTVNVQGVVRGLEIRDSGMNLIQTKYESASGKFDQIQANIYGRAQNYTGISYLHRYPIARSITHNPFEGTVQYSYEYNDRPSGLFTNSINENISIQNNFGADIFAAIPVLGRALGPVLQPINTKDKCTRSLSVEVVFDRSRYIGASGYNLMSVPHPRWTAPYSGELAYLIVAAHPVFSFAINNIGTVAQNAYISEQNENWNPNTLVYSYNIAWAYE